MRLKISSTSKLLLLSIAFNMCLLIVRYIYSPSDDYLFYPWNTFLAAIPYVISTQVLRLPKLNWLAFVALASWLLFFPNAPYIITDIFHYELRLPVPYWYDLILVISGAWNGLILGMASLMNIERFLARHLKPGWVLFCELASLLLCSYGIFIGRFLRFNSWDIVSSPKTLVYQSAHHILIPQNYAKLWVFTILFAILLGLIYFTLKNLPKMIQTANDRQ
jgi:uncharacterized membrane protein